MNDFSLPKNTDPPAKLSQLDGAQLITYFAFDLTQVGIENIKKSSCT